MSAPTPVPARLFVLLAREAPVGVIIRRGPSKWTHLTLWDTQKDIFTPGQWIHGRVYEDRCDLSPNGQLMIYAVYRPQTPYELGYGTAWTAISRPPYFTALALWPDGFPNSGGGAFRDNNSLWIHHYPEREAHPDHQPQNLKILPLDGNGDGRAAQPQYNRTGWKLTQTGQIAKYPIKWSKIIVRRDRWITQLDPPYVWQKQVSSFTLFLKYRGSHSSRGSMYEYSLRHDSIAEEQNLPLTTWADFDQQGRLIVAKEGKIFSAAVQNGELVVTELADFNANKPEAIEAPDWAKKW